MDVTGSLLQHKVDYLKVKLRMQMHGGMVEGLAAAISCVANSPERPLLGDRWKLRYFDTVGVESVVKILKIEDLNGNEVGQVRLQLKGQDPRGSSLELSGTWCRYYWEHTPAMLHAFGLMDIAPGSSVVKNSDGSFREISGFDLPHKIQRLDYAFDFAARLPAVRSLFKAGKVKDGVAKKYDLDGRPTYFCKKSKRFEFVLYDKKLDIMDNDLHLVVPAYPRAERPPYDYPYLLDMGLPITRFEFRLTSEFWLESAFTLNDLFQDSFSIVQPRIEGYFKDWGRFFAKLDRGPNASTFYNVAFAKDFETSALLEKRKKNCKTMLASYIRKSVKDLGDIETLEFFAKEYMRLGVKSENWEIARLSRILSSLNSLSFPHGFAEYGREKEKEGV